MQKRKRTGWWILPKLGNTSTSWMYSRVQTPSLQWICSCSKSLKCIKNTPKINENPKIKNPTNFFLAKTLIKKIFVSPLLTNSVAWLPCSSSFCFHLVDPLFVDLNSIGVDLEMLVFDDAADQRVQKFTQRTLTPSISERKHEQLIRTELYLIQLNWTLIKCIIDQWCYVKEGCFWNYVCAAVNLKHNSSNYSCRDYGAKLR